MTRLKRLALLVSTGLLSGALFACPEVFAERAALPDSVKGAETEVTIPAQVPLRIAVTKRTRLKRGAPVQGILLSPVFVGEQLVLPAQTQVTGHVVDTPPVDRSIRRDALLNGDFTPLRFPVVDFDSVQLPGGEARAMQTLAHVRQAELMRFVPRPRQSLFARLKTMAADRIHSSKEQVTAPHKSDRVLQFAFNQLPYHPQRIWANTDFDADLQSPLTLEVASAAPAIAAPATALEDEQPIVKARLTESVSSETAKNGDAVHASITEPAFDSAHRLIFAEGSTLTGVVVRAKRSRTLGRNGSLRFAFRSVQPVRGEAQATQGQVTGAEGQQKANVTVDEEGGVHANPDQDRFLGPLLLAVLAAHGNDSDGGTGSQGLASNGLGIVVRIVGATAGSAQFAMGVGAYGFAKSLYRHFLAHGKSVTFPRDTALEVQLSTRK